MVLDFFPAETAALFWYNEIDKYDESRPQWQDGCGHFTQLVWKASQEVGIGVDSGNGFLVVVCNFYPKGNVYGQFEENVSKDKGQTSFPIDAWIILSNYLSISYKIFANTPFLYVLYNNFEGNFPFGTLKFRWLRY